MGCSNPLFCFRGNYVLKQDQLFLYVKLMAMLSDAAACFQVVFRNKKIMYIRPYIYGGCSI